MKLEKAAFALLIFWFFALLVPEFMTDEGLPHALRAIGTLPAVYILAAWPVEYFWKKGEKNFPNGKKVIAVGFIIFLIFVGVFNVAKYNIWGKQLETARSFEKVLLNINQYLRETPAKKTVIITGNMQRIPIKLFNYQDPLLTYYHPDEIGKITQKEIENSRIILTEKNESLINQLESFHGFQMEEKTDELGLKFYILK